MRAFGSACLLLGGSRAVIRVISRVTILIAAIRGHTAPLITTLAPQTPKP